MEQFSKQRARNYKPIEWNKKIKPISLQNKQFSELQEIKEKTSNE